MKNLDIYNKFLIDNNNVIYSCDMIRLKTYINYSVYSDLDFYIRAYFSKNIKKFWISDRCMQFKYNYVIEVGENKSFYFGFHHNNEKKDDNNGLFNLTIEFNPNKLRDDFLIMHILNLSARWYIKSFDIAFDLRIGINDLIWDVSGRHIEKIDNRGYDDKTIMLGKGDGRIKIYNKKKESDLCITGELTRVEISRELEDFPVSDISLFHYDGVFPHIYINQYIYSLSDYKDKTLLAVLYAVQSGFPLKDLTRRYRENIKNLLQGGYKVQFYKKYVTDIIRQTIFFYFCANGSKQIFR